jgi:hypothetical protein
MVRQGAKDLRSPRVAILRGRGDDNARHADQLAEWLVGTDRAGLRRVLYLRDRDELAPSVLARLASSGTVHVLKRREIENYLLDPAAIAEAIGPTVPPGAPVPEVTEIADEHRRRGPAAEDRHQAGRQAGYPGEALDG